MQKLEEIMRAEEAARHTVADARERALALVRDAELAAADATASRREAAAREAAGLRAEYLEQARADAAAAAAQAASRNAVLLEQAAQRMDSAVQVALERLQG